MVLDTAFVNTEYYKVHIKGKVGQSRERSRNLPYYLYLVATKKKACMSPLTTVANLTYSIIHCRFIFLYIVCVYVKYTDRYTPKGRGTEDRQNERDRGVIKKHLTLCDI